MLNDKLETVVKNYAHLLSDGLVQEVDKWFEEKCLNRIDKSALAQNHRKQLQGLFQAFPLVATLLDKQPEMKEDFIKSILEMLSNGLKPKKNHER